MLGKHVDDLVGGGHLTFQKDVHRTELEFGTWDQSRFPFRGRELSQEYNRKSIKITMSKFAQEMEPVAVPKHVKDDMHAPLEANVHSQFRGGVGQLQWLRLQGNPLLSFATGTQQTRSATPNGHDLLGLKKLMREAKSMPDLCWWIVSLPSSFVWLTAADAAWANRPDGSSTSGHVIMAAHPNILRIAQSRQCGTPCSRKMSDESCGLGTARWTVTNPEDPYTEVRNRGCKARHVPQERLATVSDRTKWRAKLEESWRPTALALVMRNKRSRSLLAGVAAPIQSVLTEAPFLVCS